MGRGANGGCGKRRRLESSNDEPEDRRRFGRSISLPPCAFSRSRTFNERKRLFSALRRSRLARETRLDGARREICRGKREAGSTQNSSRINPQIVFRWGALKNRTAPERNGGDARAYARAREPELVDRISFHIANAHTDSRPTYAGCMITTALRSDGQGACATRHAGTYCASVNEIGNTRACVCGRKGNVQEGTEGGGSGRWKWRS